MSGLIDRAVTSLGFDSYLSVPLLAVGDVVIWDHTQSTRLFDAMRNDTPVPKSLLTGSKLATAA